MSVKTREQWNCNKGEHPQVECHSPCFSSFCIYPFLLCLVSEAYANYECLGWYSSGAEILPYDSVLHTQFKKYNERPLFVLMNPSLVSDGMRDLPLTIYEEVIHVVNDKTTSEFVKTAYVVQADEAERITVTYCAKVVNQEESGSAGEERTNSSTRRDLLAAR